MQVDPKIEQQARRMLGYAIRRQSEDLDAVVHGTGDTTLAAVIRLCVRIAGYVAIDACQHWPAEADLRELAHRAETSVTRLDMSEEEIFEFLSRVAFGTDTLDDIVSAESVVSVPVNAVANLLLAFRPQGMEWTEYLDQIWNAYNAAEMIDTSVLPALMFRMREEARGLPGNRRG